ncbi:hypothetical protein [Caenimonas sp. SL110]|uniref:hypothetical protein n=1 Tax=Caenimonas sp. SL110 TaxID=1450524 RepID=UPI00128DD698|nr:hypothetical protein [Caenimonas sp. SL110]
MSIDNSLDFFLEWLPHPGPRFEVLLPALDAIEEAISHQSDQGAVRARADLRKRGMPADEASNHLAIVHHESQQLLSRIFRCGFVVSLWSLFESSIKDLGAYVHTQKNLAFEFKVRRGTDILTASDEFFRSALNVVPFPNEHDRKQLDVLRRFRNGLAHGDGSFADVPGELAENGSVHGFCLIGHSHEFAVPSAAYVRSSLELLGSVSQSLADTVFASAKRANGAA